MECLSGAFMGWKLGHQEVNVYGRLVAIACITNVNTAISPPFSLDFSVTREIIENYL